jgi:hypothetical protein
VSRWNESIRSPRSGVTPVARSRFKHLDQDPLLQATQANTRAEVSKGAHPMGLVSSGLSAARQSIASSPRALVRSWLREEKDCSLPAVAGYYAWNAPRHGKAWFESPCVSRPHFYRASPWKVFRGNPSGPPRGMIDNYQWSFNRDRRTSESALDCPGSRQGIGGLAEDAVVVDQRRHDPMCKDREKCSI